ncbi:MAG TPA: pyruvate carboxyltransferase, partial [Bacteroidales bacterium]|nr:pyruvate carboxyltransferase [Bacteroidales bacterium]
AGTPAIGKAEQNAIQTIAQAGFRYNTSCWCRAKVEDLQVASKLGTNSVNISLPVSGVQLKSLGKDTNWVLHELKKVLNYACQHFNFVTVGAQDASRANDNFLREYIFYAQDWGANRIRINDTVGCLDPLKTKELVSDLVWYFPETEFEFHGHNDFGMATANALVAMQSGARCLSATVNGLGERAGNTVLEEVIAYVNYSLNDKRFNSKILKELSTFVAVSSNTILPQNKPITGQLTFSHESGIHTSAMLNNSKSYQIMDPSDYGDSTTQFVFGKHSGGNSLKAFFLEKGIIPEQTILSQLLDTIKVIAEDTKQSVSQEMILSLYEQFAGVRK